MATPTAAFQWHLESWTQTRGFRKHPFQLCYFPSPGTGVSSSSLIHSFEPLPPNFWFSILPSPRGWPPCHGCPLKQGHLALKAKGKSIHRNAQIKSCRQVGSDVSTGRKAPCWATCNWHCVHSVNFLIIAVLLKCHCLFFQVRKVRTKLKRDQR